MIGSGMPMGGLCRLTVSDDGVGLPPEAGLPKATGLGMKLINSLAGQLRGSVEVNRTPPGVCFQLTFPVLETSQPWTRRAETNTLHAPAYGETSADGRFRCGLVVVDDEAPKEHHLPQ
jgi:hypothetical protein